MPRERGGECIAIVEDEEPLRKLLVDAFVHAGYSIVEGRNGVEGLKAILEHQPMPALAILDIAMPEMNGLELLEKLRADPKSVRLPVIMLSNYDDQRNIDISAEHGVQFYLLKVGTRIEDILAKVDDILHAQSGSSI